MTEGFFNIEAFWEDLLSQDIVRIRTAFYRLTPEEQEATLSHLRRMVSENDWHPNQRHAAQITLNTLSRG